MSIHASGSRTTRPLTLTRPPPIQLRASVREPRPALERTRSRVFSGRSPGGGFGTFFGTLSFNIQHSTFTIISISEAVSHHHHPASLRGSKPRGRASRIPRLLGRYLPHAVRDERGRRADRRRGRGEQCERAFRPGAPARRCLVSRCRGAASGGDGRHVRSA